MCSRGTQLEGYVITSMVQLLCRTTKLCWFDDDHFRTIVEDAKAFLTKGTGGSPVSVLLCLLQLTLLHRTPSCVMPRLAPKAI